MELVKGQLVDNETRCVHYNSALDIIAIKFKCCNTFYPCFMCHQNSTNHDPQIWLKNERSTKAILCGVCKTVITIDQYLNSSNNCPSCSAQFNPGCKLHYHLYFEY